MAAPTNSTNFSNPINFSVNARTGNDTVQGDISCSITVSSKNKCVMAKAILASDAASIVQMSVVTRGTRTRISYARSLNVANDALEILMDQVGRAYVKYLRWIKTPA